MDKDITPQQGNLTSITKSVALNLREELHAGTCKLFEGKRGGLRLICERWRVNGKCKLWKTQPTAFQIPIKSGFGRSAKDYSYINDMNAQYFHLSSECEVTKEYYKRMRERDKQLMENETRIKNKVSG